jgi:hypothetical protein
MNEPLSLQNYSSLLHPRNASLPARFAVLREGPATNRNHIQSDWLTDRPANWPLTAPEYRATIDIG